MDRNLSLSVIAMPAPSDPDYRKALGQRLKTLRKERGATQKDIAQILGISFQQLNKYESGQNLPPADMLGRLARALGVTTDYLITGQQTNGQPINNTRLLERFRVLEKFPNQDLETVITVIDAMVARRMTAAAVNPFETTATTG